MWIFKNDQIESIVVSWSPNCVVGLPKDNFTHETESPWLGFGILNPWFHVLYFTNNHIMDPTHLLSVA